MSGNTFVGNGSEATVMYKRPTGLEKWKGALTIRNTVMEAMGAHPALEANKMNTSSFVLQGNTYYSAKQPNDAGTVFTSANGQQTFSNAAMSNGTFTKAMNTESAGKSTPANVTAILNKAKAV
jgi:hypothetical protein